LFGALKEIAGLERPSGANVRLELIQKDRVVLAVFDICREIGNPA